MHVLRCNSLEQATNAEVVCYSNSHEFKSELNRAAKKELSKESPFLIFLV